VIPLATLAVTSAMAVWFAQERPGRLDLDHAWYPPSWEHPLGCGEGGVDLCALVGAAELRAMALGGLVALAGFAIGAPAGAAAALARGRAERGLERACDMAQSLPTFILALGVLSALRDPSRWAMGAVFALTAWTPFARLSLAQTRALRNAAFVEAAIALGSRPGAVLLRHVMPQLLSVAAVQLGSTAAAVVVGEAGLAFVGFGPRDGVSLGGVLDQGVVAMLRAPHVMVIGSAAVTATSAALIAAGRALAPLSPAS
jgi:peptide/nickel transport system permease protein